MYYVNLIVRRQLARDFQEAFDIYIVREYYILFYPFWFVLFFFFRGFSLLFHVCLTKSERLYMTCTSIGKHSIIMTRVSCGSKYAYKIRLYE